jgi:hypothetical protein
MRRAAAAWAVPAAVLVAAASWQNASLRARAGIDPSWEIALHLTWTRGISFGGGFAWTYGPLGFLAFPIAVSGGTLIASFVAVALAEIALAYLLIRRAAVAVGAPAAVVLAYLVLALPVHPADLLLLIELILAVLALERVGRHAEWFPATGGVVAGLAALTKTNTGAAAVAIAVVVCVALGRRALVGIGVVVLVFLAGWLASGSSPAGIPEWLRLSAGLVSGYGAAMQTEHPGLHYEYLYAAVVVALFLAAVAVCVPRLGRARGIALVVVAAGFAFAFFKEGFVRHDAFHSSSFFAAIAIACVAFAGRGASRWLALAGVVVAIFAVHRSHELNYTPVSSARRAVSQLVDVTVSHRRGALVRDSRSSEKLSYLVPPRLLAELRGHTVHVDPLETAAINSYGLAWRPLPVLQAYSAYTPALDEHNAAFLGSASAPQRVLRGDLALLVNNRLHELEAPAEFRALICDYVQLGVSASWQVLARHAPRCGQERELGVVTTASDVPVPVPDAKPDELVIARVHSPDPFLNRVRGLLYKPRLPGISFDGEAFVTFDSAVGPDGIVVHVPATAGFAPAFGGAIDWRTIAVGSLGGPVRIEFDAIRVSGRVLPPSGERTSTPLPAYALVGDAVRTQAGRKLTVGSGGGFVNYAFEQDGRLVLRGWAADVSAGVPARTILVFANGKLVFAGPPNTTQPGVAHALGKPALARSGYSILVPDRDVRANGARRHVRVIALAGGRALELTYFPDYAWR